MSPPAAEMRRVVLDRRSARRPVDRLVAGFLLVLMVLGSLALWIAVPAVILSLLLPLSESRPYHLAVGLVGVPLGMALFASWLLWLNALFLRVTGHWPDDGHSNLRRLRGPLEPLLAGSFVLAVVALLVWFFFLEKGAPTGYL